MFSLPLVAISDWHSIYKITYLIIHLGLSHSLNIIAGLFLPFFHNFFMQLMSIILGILTFDNDFFHGFGKLLFLFVILLLAKLLEEASLLDGKWGEVLVVTRRGLELIKHCWCINSRILNKIIITEIDSFLISSNSF